MALNQFDKYFGIFNSHGSANNYARNLNGSSEYARSNIINNAAVFSEIIPTSTYKPHEECQYFVHAELSPWGKHALLWLNKGCVYDLHLCSPNHDLTAQMYEEFLEDQRIPHHVFHTAQSLPRNSSYARIKDKLIQFKLAATARNGLYEMGQQ